MTGVQWDAEPFVVRITTDINSSHPELHALLVDSAGSIGQTRFSLLLVRQSSECSCKTDLDQIVLVIPNELRYLGDGDILRINPRRGELWVMYRRQSPHNNMLLTERCNSYCVMCSQPPRARDDSWLAKCWLAAIPLMHAETRELGITGGEPTLLKDQFHDVIRACITHLPNTSVHVLSNGRSFNYLSFARELAAIGHPSLMIGIPLYSDIAWRHDFVVQATGAFDQTIRGIMNLARVGVAVEIRMVIHRYTVDRLVRFAEFLARNLPFVDHVALMGLEPIGFGRTNFEALWVDPTDYQDELEAAVALLNAHGMCVSIYNHQLCVLREELWPHARKSISDWKNVYLPVCRECSKSDACGGFFASALVRHSRAIKPIQRAACTECDPVV